jgi:hypothetical protein
VSPGSRSRIPPRKLVHPFQGLHPSHHSPPMSGQVGGEVCEEGEVRLPCHPTQDLARLPGGDPGDPEVSQDPAPPVVHDLAGHGFPASQGPVVPGEESGGAGRQGGSRHPAGVTCSGVALGVGIGEDDAGPVFLGLPEEIPLLQEGAEPHRGPRTEVASEDAGGVLAGEEGDLPGTALGKAFHSEGGVHGEGTGARPNGRRCVQGGKLPGEEVLQDGEAGPEEGIHLRVLRTDPHPIQEEEENTPGAGGGHGHGLGKWAEDAGVRGGTQVRQLPGRRSTVTRTATWPRSARERMASRIRGSIFP